MRPISAAVKNKLELDPRMRRCALWGVSGFDDCEGRVEWHHVWIYAGRQIDEAWAIVGACTHHHKQADSRERVKQGFEVASLVLATLEDLQKYPRKDWVQIYKTHFVPFPFVQKEIPV